MKNWIVLTLAMVLIAAMLFIGSLFATGEILEFNSSGTNKFTIDVPMTKVRKILVRTDAGKKLIAMSDAEFVNQDWSELDLEADQPLRKRDWDISSSGVLTVQTTDPLVGNHELNLKQDLQIQPELLEIKSHLTEPSGPIRNYQSSLTIVPDEAANTQIDATLSLTYRQQVNWLTKSYAEKRIHSAADRSLARQEEGLRKAVAEYADQLFILPNLKKSK